MKHLFVICFVALLFPINCMAAIDYGSFDKPMTFTIADNGGNCSGCEWISATGTIEKDTAQKLEEFLAENKYTLTIIFNSPGGNLIGGMELGRVIRAHNLATDVGKTAHTPPDPKFGEYPEHIAEITPGICASACAYAFLGGATRIIENGSKLGFHEFYGDPVLEASAKHVDTGEFHLSTDQLISGVIAAYLVEMGVDARVLTLASMADKNNLMSLDEKEFKKLGVLTNNDFGPWKMDVLGNGIAAHAERDSVSSPERGVTSFCLTNKKYAVFQIITDKTQKLEGEAGEAELAKEIQGVAYQIDDNKEVELPRGLIKTKISGQRFLINIFLPEPIKNSILSSSKFRFKVDTAHYFFGTWIDVSFETDSDLKKMLQFSWSNCS